MFVYFKSEVFIKTLRANTYDNSSRFEPFQHNNLYQMLLCAKFRAKQTNFEPLYARKFQKNIKNIKNVT